MTPPLWRRYLRFWRNDVDAHVDDEIRFHLDMRRLDFEAAYAVARTKLEELLASATHYGMTLAQRLVAFAEVGTVVFPRGTWHYWRRYGLPCAAAPSSA